MAAKPSMGIPWSNPSTSSAEAAPISSALHDGASDMENLSASALKEKIELIESQLSSGLGARLPDKGLKLRSHVSFLREKLRKHATAANDGCKVLPQSISDPKSRDSETNDGWKVLPPSIDPKPQDSETNGFKDGGPDSACETGNASKLKPSSPTPIKSDRSSCIGSPPPSVDRRMSTRSSKRRRASGEWEEVHAVVLLDEGDEPPITHKTHDLKDAKIYYPSRDHPECVEICYSDVKCLDPLSYITSTIMNFYIQYLQKTISPLCRLSTECHFFNTYFYRKLEEAVCCKVDRNATFAKLRRWLKGVNLFQKAYVFLPIHGDQHWSLVIICIPSLEDETGPIILHLDSLGFHDGNRIFKSIETYLREEWEHICRNASDLSVPISEKVWGELPRRILRRKITVPQQKNDYDCGLFVLYFIQRFIEEAPERLKKKDLAMFGSKWFHPEEASGLRRHIQKLLMEEFKRARRGTDSTELNGSSALSVESNGQKHDATNAL